MISVGLCAKPGGDHIHKNACQKSHVTVRCLLGLAEAARGEQEEPKLRQQPLLHL